MPTLRDLMNYDQWAAKYGNVQGANRQDYDKLLAETGLTKEQIDDYRRYYFNQATNQAVGVDPTAVNAGWTPQVMTKPDIATGSGMYDYTYGGYTQEGEWDPTMRFMNPKSVQPVIPAENRIGGNNTSSSNVVQPFRNAEGSATPPPPPATPPATLQQLMQGNRPDQVGINSTSANNPQAPEYLGFWREGDPEWQKQVQEESQGPTSPQVPIAGGDRSNFGPTTSESVNRGYRSIEPTSVQQPIAGGNRATLPGVSESTALGIRSGETIVPPPQSAIPPPDFNLAEIMRVAQGGRAQLPGGNTIINPVSRIGAAQGREDLSGANRGVVAGVGGRAELPGTSTSIDPALLRAGSEGMGNRITMPGREGTITSTSTGAELRPGMTGIPGRTQPVIIPPKIPPKGDETKLPGQEPLGPIPDWLKNSGSNIQDLISKISANTGIKPGDPGYLTLATMMQQKTPGSWLKPGAGYGDILYGGAPSGRMTEFNETGRPFSPGQDTLAYRYNKAADKWETRDTSGKVKDVRELPWMQLPWMKQYYQTPDRSKGEVPYFNAKGEAFAPGDNEAFYYDPGTATWYKGNLQGEITPVYDLPWKSGGTSLLQQAAGNLPPATTQGSSDFWGMTNKQQGEALQDWFSQWYKSLPADTKSQMYKDYGENPDAVDFFSDLTPDKIRALANTLGAGIYDWIAKNPDLMKQ